MVPVEEMKYATLRSLGEDDGVEGHERQEEEQLGFGCASTIVPGTMFICKSAASVQYDSRYDL
jgi:hypothetical protein